MYQLCVHECNNDSSAPTGCERLPRNSIPFRDGSTGKNCSLVEKKRKKITARDDKIDTGSCKRTLHGLFAMIKVLKTDLPLPPGGE